MRTRLRLIQDPLRGLFLTVGAHALGDGWRAREMGLDLVIGVLPHLLHAWTVGWGWEETIPLRPWFDLTVDTLPDPTFRSVQRVCLSGFGFFLCVCPCPTRKPTP